MGDVTYHLLISDGGLDCVCIIAAPRGSKFTPEQKNKLIELYGEYIVIPINYLSLSCYPRLDIIGNLDGYLGL